MNTRINLKLFLIGASLLVCFFALATSAITISYFNQRMSCIYKGLTYQNGAKFNSEDGCNICTCNNGSVACTEKSCERPMPRRLGISTIKNANVYCYKKDDVLVFTIVAGPKPKTIDPIINEMLSYPQPRFIGKLRSEALSILQTQFGYSESQGNLMLDSCTVPEELR